GKLPGGHSEQPPRGAIEAAGAEDGALDQVVAPGIDQLRAEIAERLLQNRKVELVGGFERLRTVVLVTLALEGEVHEMRGLFGAVDQAELPDEDRVDARHVAAPLPHRVVEDVAHLGAGEAAGLEQGLEDVELIARVDLRIGVDEELQAGALAREAVGISVDPDEVHDRVDEVVDRGGQIELLVLLILGLPDLELAPVSLVLLEGSGVQDAVDVLRQLDLPRVFGAAARQLPVDFVDVLEDRQ